MYYIVPIGSKGRASFKTLRAAVKSLIHKSADSPNDTFCILDSELNLVPPRVYAGEVESIMQEAAKMSAACRREIASRHYA